MCNLKNVIIYFTNFVDTKYVYRNIITFITLHYAKGELTKTTA